MSAFREWFFAHVYLPHKRRWARRRVEELVRQQDERYARLMAAVRDIEHDVIDNTTNSKARTWPD